MWIRGFSVSEIVAMLNDISKDLGDIVVSETNKNVFDPTPHTDVVVARGKVPRGALPPFFVLHKKCSMPIGTKHLRRKGSEAS